MGSADGRERDAGREQRGRERGSGDPAASRPLCRLLPTRPRLRTAAGPSGAEPGRVRAASVGPRPSQPGQQQGREREPSEPGLRHPEEAREEARYEPSSPLRGRYHCRRRRRRRHSRLRRRPALTRRPPGTSAARDAPEAGWVASRGTQGPGWRGQPIGGLFWGVGLRPGWAPCPYKGPGLYILLGGVKRIVAFCVGCWFLTSLTT